ncbi:homospermidine synthase [Limibacillus halophilus]|uniref:Homospermidine synthase n=1 Tax=Limibacillus halophilus TaxID=1579333 RepID=A0A839SY54_9PROT|nr:saccharopine dehydrogenase C-terminal domain-containing protein [Limibacillus halophilus]MBB3066600.1 homospermidine synthase [Limibacillus halophilus]
MANWPIHASFDGDMVMIGFGSIGKGSLPLILRHIAVDPKRVTVISPDDSGRPEAEALGVTFVKTAITPENLAATLDPLFTKPGGFLVNLSVEVSSLDLIRYAATKDALYIDTCIEPWPGGYTDPSLSPSERSNYALRETALALRAELGTDSPTAVLTHGANPGMVSHLVKQALLNLAKDLDVATDVPRTRAGWSALAERLGVKGIHIAERDTQVTGQPKPKDVFHNTWSIDGFISEGLQPTELGWGSFEGDLPFDGGEHAFGEKAAIYLNRPGCTTRVRTWTPAAGSIIGYLITHSEAISIADYFTIKNADGSLRYRPTCHYAYHPCDDAILSLHEMQGNGLEPQSRFRLLNDEIIQGMDELGVLLYGHAKNAYWYGSQLSIEEARELAPYQNATGLQVTSAVLAGMVWALENPRRGVVEPDEMDFDRVLEIQMPYLGPVIGQYSDWTPLKGREALFPEDVDRDEPWRFKNVIVR